MLRLLEFHFRTILHPPLGDCVAGEQFLGAGSSACCSPEARLPRRGRAGSRKTGAGRAAPRQLHHLFVRQRPFAGREEKHGVKKGHLVQSLRMLFGWPLPCRCPSAPSCRRLPRRRGGTFGHLRRPHACRGCTLHPQDETPPMLLRRSAAWRGPSLQTLGRRSLPISASCRLAAPRLTCCPLGAGTAACCRYLAQARPQPAAAAPGARWQTPPSGRRGSCGHRVSAGPAPAWPPPRGLAGGLCTHTGASQ